MGKINIKANSIAFVQGFCVGTADIVPGVSGGTMAFILGIYTRLIHAIRSFDLKWLKSLLRGDLNTVVMRADLAFLLPFAIGIVAALFFFTRVIALPQLLVTAPQLVYGLFFGLVSGSTLVLLKAAGRPDIRAGLIFCVGLLVGLTVVAFTAFNTTNASWFIMFCGMLAIMAMLLPGISGSLILLMLDKYGYIFGAIARLEFSVMLPFIAGVFFGLVFFSRILSWFLRSYYKQTLFLMLGLLCASLRVLWPFQQRTLGGVVAEQALLPAFAPFSFALDDKTVMLTILLMLLGLFIALSLNMLCKTQS